MIDEVMVQALPSGLDGQTAVAPEKARAATKNGA